jgi:hypothetical protein
MDACFMMCAHGHGSRTVWCPPQRGSTERSWEWWPGVGDLRLMGTREKATEPSRTDALTAYFRTRVLLASWLNGELTRHSSMLKSGRSLSIPEPRPVGRSLRGMASIVSFSFRRPNRRQGTRMRSTHLRFAEAAPWSPPAACSCTVGTQS